jgi:UDP-2,3-diacylglucosamine hydrolase
MPGDSGGDRSVRGGRVLFVSDVHLTPEQPEIQRLFGEFLDLAAGARALYVLGDLFDYWVGQKQARLPGFAEVLDRLRDLAENGTDVHFMAGNRDFMLDHAFASSLGMRPLPDVAAATVGDKRVLLTHGDLLCTRDLPYHRMRRVIRSRLARLLMRAMPLRAGIRLAGGFRQASGKEISRKSAYVLDPDFEEARRWLERGYDALVFGHVHRGERYRVTLPDREADIFILGSWEDAPSYVEWDGRELRLRAYPGA